MFGRLFEVEVCKICTPLWRQSDLEAKPLKHQVLGALLLFAWQARGFRHSILTKIAKTYCHSETKCLVNKSYLNAGWRTGRIKIGMSTRHWPANRQSNVDPWLPILPVVDNGQNIEIWLSWILRTEIKMLPFDHKAIVSTLLFLLWGWIEVTYKALLP